MSPQQQAALEALAGRPLTPAELAQIAPWLDPDRRRDDLIAALLSVGRTEVRPRMTSARGLAELMPGGPLAAEAVLLKLEGARDSMLASADAQQRVLGSLLRRQLGFLAGEGLDFGSAALRGMLDQFATLGILTGAEVAALKSIGVREAKLSTSQVSDALNAVMGA